MGRFAEVVGINVKGSVRLELEKRELVAGEVLRGVAYVNMHAPVQAEVRVLHDALVLVIKGQEKTSWQEKSGENNRWRHHSADCFKQQVTLATLPPLCEPGDYVYPFEYQLPSTLPGTTLIKRCNFFGCIRQLKIQLWYTLEVRLRANGFLVADLSAQTRLWIHAAPPEYADRGLEASVSKDVNFLALFSKGSCDITAVLQQCTQAAGGLVVVNANVHNDSRRTLKSVSLQLIQTINLNNGGEISRTIRDRQFPGVDAGEHFTRALELLLESTYSPTCTTASLFSVRYVLRIKCRYSCCPPPRLDFPFTVLAQMTRDSGESAMDVLTQRYAPIAIPISTI